jgi:ABC-type branched-subunit amino acid transport system ATPase component
MLAVEGLAAQYGRAQILEGVTLGVEEGEVP